MLNFFIGFAFFEFGALCGFFVAALMQAARDGGEIAGRNRTKDIEKSTEECGAVLRRGKRPQGKIADPLSRKHRGFFPFWGKSSVFFFVIGAFGTNVQPASGGCSIQRVWDYPNKHFAKQNSICIDECPACWYNVIDETKIVSSKTVIWLCRFPKHSNIEVLTGAESGKTACLVSIQELLTA